jgi:hypothetical protein
VAGSVGRGGVLQRREHGELRRRRGVLGPERGQFPGRVVVAVAVAVVVVAVLVVRHGRSDLVAGSVPGCDQRSKSNLKHH